MAELLTARSRGQWVLLGLVGLALLLLGLFDERVRGLLTELFTAAPVATPTGVNPAAATAPVGGAVLTTRNIPAMIVFGLSYVGLSILTLHLALANRRQTWLVCLVYAGVFGLISVLLVLGRVLGQPATFTPPARELIDTILSPLPVLLLLAALRLAPR